MVQVDIVIENAMFHIRREFARSVKRYNTIVTTDPVRASALLINEASEVLSEALKMTNPTGTASHRNAKGTREAMIEELSHVGNLVVQMIYNLENQQ